MIQSTYGKKSEIRKFRKKRSAGCLPAVCLLLITILLFSFTACKTREKLSGTYSCIAAETGEEYIFSGISNVRIRLYVMGEVVLDLRGTYQISGDFITFSLRNDSDGAYNGIHSFEKIDGNSIRIDEGIYTKDDP